MASVVITIIYVPPSSSLQREGTRGNPESYLDRDYKTHKEVHEICLFCDHDLREDFSLFPRRRHSAHIAQLKQHSILQASYRSVSFSQRGAVLCDILDARVAKLLNAPVVFVCSFGTSDVFAHVPLLHSCDNTQAPLRLSLHDAYRATVLCISHL